ncbi:MAG TPA: ATP-binding cassette domain-containing protein [Methylomirabilota bacterium]|jgi:branched-chain amino acid transport system ATP-binding protein|nr:ATP-binding cassette domain-containing protein [Methylomirabilota bacterium]HEV8615247.1 ATP-binding cassette domain-containing protein [Methylomirabilota bacterium]
MLSLERVDVSIQASEILRSVTLEVGAREIVCLVGRNGAGKTTTLRTVMGYLRPAAGAIRFKDEAIGGLPTHAIAARGIGYSPEESQIFGDLTVAENIEIATWTRATARPAAERIAAAYEVFPRLRAYAGRGGTQLSGGERKMLSIARALALDPDLLLLDEPFEGLSPAIIPAITGSIAAITHLGPALLVAESNIHHVPETVARLYVMERGEIIFAGSLHEAHHDAAVMRVIGGRAS